MPVGRVSHGIVTLPTMPPTGPQNRVIGSPPAAAGTPRPLWPPRRVWITLASLAAATLMVRANLLEPIVGGVVDQAVRNIISLILCFSGLVTLLLW